MAIGRARRMTQSSAHLLSSTEFGKGPQNYGYRRDAISDNICLDALSLQATATLREHRGHRI